MEALILIAIIPVVLLGFYIYKKDLDKEPSSLIRKAFCFGMLSVIPIVILELIVGGIISTENKSNLIGLFIATLIGVGRIEELFKWLVVYKKSYNHQEFNHAYDAIVYAVFASLGFAFVENLFYVLSNDITVGLVRALLTVPSHACDGIIMGYFLGKAKGAEINQDQICSNKYMLYSLLVPVLAHTIYDYLIFAENTICYILFAIFIIVLYIYAFKIVKKVSKVNYNFDGTPVNYKSNDKKYTSVNSLESAYYAVSKTLYICLGAIVCAIIILLII